MADRTTPLPSDHEPSLPSVTMSPSPSPSSSDSDETAQLESRNEERIKNPPTKSEESENPHTTNQTEIPPTDGVAIDEGHVAKNPQEETNEAEEAVSSLGKENFVTENSQVSLSESEQRLRGSQLDGRQQDSGDFVPSGALRLPDSVDSDAKAHEAPPKQQILVAVPSSQKTIQNNSNSQAVCHPSKLSRGRSESTEQPPPLSRDTSGFIQPQNMAPNFAPNDDLDFVSEKDAEAKPDVSAMLPRSTDDTDASLSTHQSLPEPAVNEREGPPLQQISASMMSNRRPSYSGEDILDTSSMMVGPAPGTVIIQQPNGSYVQTLTPQHSFGYPLQMLQHAPVAIPPQLPPHMMAAPQPAALTGGRRKITLNLQEDVPITKRKGFFFRSSRSNLMGDGLTPIQEGNVNRGSVTVSWFEGTTSVELQEHVRKSVIRKMGLPDDVTLDDMRIIDQTMDPPEEIVLSPFIPDGSKFLLRFNSKKPKRSPEVSAPGTPSAAPSPDPSSALTSLNAQLLAKKLNVLNPPRVPSAKKERRDKKAKDAGKEMGERGSSGASDGGNEGKREDTDAGSKDDDDTASRRTSDYHHEDDVMSYHPEDNIEARLKQLADLMIADRRSRMRTPHQTKEKRQVIFVLANYFILFLSLIFISAEIQSRVPEWLHWVEAQLKNVQKCSKGQEALYECVSEGDFSGLIASFILWISRSAATKRFFLFGFESPKKLWTVVYESMVTAVCWGTSYMFIRRGMNPDTRTNFLRKYWKDAVYGSLAGFNASFMKQVLKNLIPQEALEGALQERQLKILSWLPSFN